MNCEWMYLCSLFWFTEENTQRFNIIYKFFYIYFIIYTFKYFNTILQKKLICYSPYLYYKLRYYNLLQTKLKFCFDLSILSKDNAINIKTNSQTGALRIVELHWRHKKSSINWSLNLPVQNNILMKFYLRYLKEKISICM